MENWDRNVLKLFRKSLLQTVDQLLNEHLKLNSCSELTFSEFYDCINTITKSPTLNNVLNQWMNDYELCSIGSKRNFLFEQQTTGLDEWQTFERVLSQGTLDIDSLTLLLEQQLLLIDYVAANNSGGKWLKLAKRLRDGLINRNRDIFCSTFKIHVKLSCHPQTICTATFNLITTLNVIFQTRSTQCAYADGIDLNNSIQKHNMKIVDLVLHNIKFIEKNYSVIMVNDGSRRSRRRPDDVMDNLIEKFLQLCNIHLVCSHEKSDYVHFFNYLSILDPQAHWFHQFTYNLVHRKIVINFCARNKSFLKYLISELTNRNEIYVTTKKSWITLDVIKFATFVHSAHLLSCLLAYKEVVQKFFPSSTMHSLLLFIITSINTVSSEKKRNVFIETLVKILAKNGHFLLYHHNSNNNIMNALMKPLLHNSNAIILRRNVYILHIINNALLNEQDGFLILFNSFDDKRKKQRSSAFSSTAKIIVELTGNLLDYYIVNSDGGGVDYHLLYQLFNCITNIYHSHYDVVHLMKNLIGNLITTTMQFYQINRNDDCIGKFVISLCSTQSGLHQIITNCPDDDDLLYSICKRYYSSLTMVDCWNCRQFMDCFVNLANTRCGCRAIVECQQLMVPLFSNLHDDSSFNHFIQIVHLLSYHSMCISTMLQSATTNDDNNSRVLNLRSLVEFVIQSNNNNNNNNKSTINTDGDVLCVLGLTTIRILINNLNTLILLQHTLALQDTLMQAEISMIDECSLLRQNIIHFIDCVGIIKRSSQLKSQRSSARRKRLNDFQRFLNDSRSSLHDHNWLLQARKIYKQVCKCDCSFKDSDFVDLMQQIRSTISNSKTYFTWPDHREETVSNYHLFPEDLIGIKLIISFGVSNKILPSECPYQEILIILLKQINVLLNIKRGETFYQFDWFIGVLFLMCGGNADKCKTVLQCLMHLPVAPYIWPAFGKQMESKTKFTYSAQFDYAFNILMEDFHMMTTTPPVLENVYISWKAIMQCWIKQCFFNVLKWNEIFNYVLICMLFPPEYILFYLISIVQYSKEQFQHCTKQSEFHKQMLQLDGFQINKWFRSMDQMEKQYKNILMKNP